LSSKEPEVLTLKMPASRDFVDVARLMVAGLGARMDFTYDDVEDLKIAIEEALGRTTRESGEVVSIEFLVFQDRLDVCLRGVPRSVWNEKKDQLILKAVTDEVRVSVSGDTCDLHLLKYKTRKTA
jgi:hypothetical protein